MMMDFVELTNVMIFMGAAGGLFWRGNDDWERLTRGWRIVLGFLVLTYFSLMWISIVRFATNAELSWPFQLVTFTAAGCLAGLWFARNDVTLPGARMIESDLVLEAIAEADDPKYGDPCTHPGCLATRGRVRTVLKRAPRKRLFRR